MHFETQLDQVRRALAWALLFIAILFSIVVRCRLAEFPLERDEGEYAYAGQLLLQGEPPYKFAYNMKLPGTYLAYAGLMAVFGQTVQGIRYGMLAVNLGTIVLLYVLTRDLFDRCTAGGAALMYAILSASGTVLGMSAHATHFVTFFGVAGTVLMWRSVLHVGAWRAMASGLMFGLAFLMKQQGVFLMVFGGTCLVVQAFRCQPADRFRRVRDLTLFSLAACLPYGLTCWWLWSVGVWKSFQFWTIDYASQYIQNVSWYEGIGRGIECTLPAVGANLIFWMWAGLGLFATIDESLSHTVATTKSLDMEFKRGLLSTEWSARIWFALGYLAFSTLCILPGWVFREHYYVVVLPAVALFASVCLLSPEVWTERSSLLRWSREWWNSGATDFTDHPTSTMTEPQQTVMHSPSPDRTSVHRTDPSDPYRRVMLSSLLLGLGVGITVLAQSNIFFLESPTQISRAIYSFNPFPESAAIAAYLREHTQPSDRIAVLGSEPQLYFLSQRRSCTGYIYVYPLMENQPFAQRMQEEMIHEIEQAAPAYLVDVHIAMSWSRQNDDDQRIFAWERTYLQDHYELVGVVDIPVKHETVFRWDREVQGYSPESQEFVAVYKRR